MLNSIGAEPLIVANMPIIFDVAKKNGQEIPQEYLSDIEKVHTCAKIYLRFITNHFLFNEY